VRKSDHAADVPGSAISDVFKGDTHWAVDCGSEGGETYRWNSSSTYVQNPPLFSRGPAQ